MARLPLQPPDKAIAAASERHMRRCYPPTVAMDTSAITGERRRRSHRPPQRPPQRPPPPLLTTAKVAAVGCDQEINGRCRRQSVQSPLSRAVAAM